MKKGFLNRGNKKAKTKKEGKPPPSEIPSATTDGGQVVTQALFPPSVSRPNGTRDVAQAALKVIMAIGEH